MPRYTAAYSSFIVRVSEVDILRRLALRRERDNAVALSPSINALCRGSLVLLSSHLEAFIEELGDLTLERMFTRKVPRTNLASQFFYHLSKDIISELKDSTQPDAIASKVFKLIGRDVDLWSKVGPFPRSLPADLFNKDFSNPAFNKIKSYFNRFGYSQFGHDLGAVLAANYQPVINMVDHLVDVRNKIAHGDMAITKTPTDVADVIRLTRLFCMKTDQVFASWCRSTLCSIN